MSFTYLTLSLNPHFWSVSHICKSIRFLFNIVYNAHPNFRLKIWEGNKKDSYVEFITAKLSLNLAFVHVFIGLYWLKVMLYFGLQLGQKCHSEWCTGRKWHILMAVMRGNHVGGKWLMKWDEVKKKIPMVHS